MTEIIQFPPRDGDDEEQTGSAEGVRQTIPYDLIEAAARLYAALHEADARGVTRLAVAPISEEGFGRAINDRLRRAAAPRD